MLKANKGEWSEIYTLLKLLGDTSICAGNEKLEQIVDLFFPIITILRREESDYQEFNIDNKERCIIICINDVEKKRIPIKIFKEKANILYNAIKNGSGSSFEVPEIEEFMHDIYCSKVKASSLNKTDIRIKIHDSRINQSPVLGFSIKSRLGGPSTLLNSGNTTNFIYKIKNIALSNDDINFINSLNPQKGKIQVRIKALLERGCILEYSHIESEIFACNLEIIDSLLPKAISYMLLDYYSGNASNLNELTQNLNNYNPLNYNQSFYHNFYSYKIKHLLTDIALGMTPGTPWNGIYDANGGYIIIKEDGDILCYHIYNKNDFENYLLNNTKLDTPSSSRYNFGKIEDNNGILIFKLNLQIRFK